MSSPKYASIHIIGVGGTGTNIIQTLVESDKLSRLLTSEDFGMSCVAVDIADGDLNGLQAAYKKRMAELASKGIPTDRLWVKTLNVKFNAPDALFEFMEKYNSYLLKEGITINNYRPWISSATSIPPLAGGVGRQRALSKAVYALNYYHYVELNSLISVFKDRVLTSKLQPIVLIVFGLGGGTGSGMVFDFARHLRTKLGTAVPIIALAILPSAADDLLARGPAPYTALMEAELLFNREMNDKVTSKYGESYRNPFSGMFFIPLDPVYNNKSSLMSAKKELDEAMVDIINLLMNFDLADLLGRVGTNNDFGPNWAHTLAYLKIRYPVEDYVSYQHQYLRILETTGDFALAKKEVLTRINDVMKSRYGELVELYRRYQVTTGGYRAEVFESEVENVINRGGRYDINFRKQMKGIEDFVTYYNDRWTRVFKATVFPEDTAEHAVVWQVQKWIELVSKISKTYDEFSKDLTQAAAEIENSITASKFLTSSQIKQVRSYMGFVNMVSATVKILKTYLRAVALGEELATLYAKDQTKEGRRAAMIGDGEVVPLFKTASAIMSMPETEIKMFDQLMPGLRIVRRNVGTRYKEESEETESQLRLVAQKQTETDRLKREISKVRIDLSGKKKSMQRNVDSLQNEVIGLNTALEQRKKDDERLRMELEVLTELEKSIEAASQYRKDLNSIVSQTNELNSLMSSITSTSSYFERVVELSENEQLKIMEKILKEEESSLKGEGILNEIVDKQRFRNLVRSYVRIFSVPNYAGLADNYRTDMLWGTVGIPGGLWDQELQVMLTSTLNVFSSVEASKSISIRQIPQVDPWTITFLIISAKARLDQIKKFASMKNDTEAVRRAEKIMFRAFLLEHGAQDINELIAQLEAKTQT